MSDKNIEDKAEDKKLYELGFHILPSVSEGKVSDEVENLKKSLTKIDAEIVKEGETKLIELAYEITKKINEVNERFNSSYFGWVKFNATAAGVESLKSELDANKNLLRYLLVKTVDDDEHSTAKIATEESKKAEEAEKAEKEEKADAKTSDDSEEKVEPTAEDDAKNSGEKIVEEKAVDEAIDALVE